MIDLSSLNNEQLEAVKDDENNLLILACAGSGKTKTITTKIAYAIETGRLKPYEICAVTFTNRAAKEMRDRVALLLPDVDTDSIVLRTFHSLGATLLRRFGMAIGLSSDFTIYDDDDSLQLLLSSAGEEYKEGQNKKKYLREIQKCISKAKDYGLGPDSNGLDSICNDPNFRPLFQGYEEALSRTGNVDFADLIKKAKELLECDETARNYCHRRFKLVMVDEYQDSNREQFNFLRLFVGEDTQLVVVGDDDQSIYSFRGAEVENILTFSSNFRNVREIKLEKNYRSTDEILAPAATLIRHNSARHEKDIVSADNKHGQKPVVLCSASGVIEAKRVTNIILSERDYNNTAVLYRTNAQSQAFETEFMANKIPYKVIGALKFYDREEVKDGLAFLRLLINHKDEISFRRIINKPSRGLGDKKVDEIVSYSLDLMEGLKTFVSNTKGKASEGAASFLSSWEKGEKALEDNENLGNILYAALQDTGLLLYYNSEKDEMQKRSKLDNLSQLVSVLSGEEKEEDSLLDDYGVVNEPDSKKALRSFLENITLDTTVLGTEDPRDKEGVTLITMHNTKGLEFDKVFCVGIENEFIPGRNNVDPSSKEEERRIMYVAMTRAKRKLYLSYATSRKLWGQYIYPAPSCFLKEIPERMLIGDTDKLFKTSSSSSSSFSAGFSPYGGVYRDNYTHSWKEKERSTYVSNTPSWANKISGLPKQESPKKEVAEPKRERGFKEGDRVKDGSRGEGSVTNIEKKDDGRIIVTVVFDSGKQMRFVEGNGSVVKI